MRRRAGGPTRIEGARPVIEAIRAGRRRVLEVSMPPLATTPGLRELDVLVTERRLPRIDTAPGQDVSARAETYPEVVFEDLLAAPGPHLLVALDRVTDVGNLGSIARSAETAGATGLILEQRRSPAIGPGALRASAGALEHLPVGRVPNLGRALELARAEGLGILAADPAGVPTQDLDPRLLSRDLIWLFGSEDRGIRPALQRLVDQNVAIPLRGEVASLGVAAAAAYLLHRTSEVRGRA